MSHITLQIGDSDIESLSLEQARALRGSGWDGDLDDRRGSRPA